MSVPADGMSQSDELAGQDDGDKHRRNPFHDKGYEAEHVRCESAVVCEFVAEERAWSHPSHIDAEEDSTDGEHDVGGHGIEKIKDGEAADFKAASRAD